MAGRRLKGVAGTHDPDLKLHLFLSKGAWLRNNAGRQRNKEAGPRRGCDAGHRQGAQTWARAPRDQPLWGPLPSQDWARSRCGFRLKNGPTLVPISGLKMERDLTEFGTNLAYLLAQFWSRIWTRPRPLRWKVLERKLPHVETGVESTGNYHPSRATEASMRLRRFPHSELQKQSSMDAQRS